MPDVDEFVIMPDHVYGIIWLDGTKENAIALEQVIGAYKSITTVAWPNYHKKLGVVCSKHLWQKDFLIGETIVSESTNLILAS